ncbi:MAG: SDR family oxidoreductase [Myxococcales bacterium]|nr:SDR family oxidoreductase [Myxococcales bacterium]
MSSPYRHDLLQDQVAWITGGGSGIGEGIALQLAKHGAAVALTGRKEASLQRVATRIADEGGRASVHPADVRDPQGLEDVVSAITERWGRLDILINGAAGNFLCPAHSLSPNGFSSVIDIDLKGTFHACKAAFPALSERGGSIVNISATLQLTGTPLQVHAVSAKAGIDALTRTLAVEWGGAGIRINALAPGPIDGTPGMDKLAPGDMRDRVVRSIPLQRLGTVDDVALAVLFLVGPASAWTTGSFLVVDGGQWLSSGGLGAVFQ